MESFAKPVTLRAKKILVGEIKFASVFLVVDQGTLSTCWSKLHTYQELTVVCDVHWVLESIFLSSSANGENENGTVERN